MKISQFAQDNKEKKTPSGIAVMLKGHNISLPVNNWMRLNPLCFPILLPVGLFSASHLGPEAAFQHSLLSSLLLFADEPHDQTLLQTVTYV